MKREEALTLHNEDEIRSRQEDGLTENEILQIEKLNDAIHDIHRVLEDIGFAPGNEIWAVRKACYNCPEYDDHCGIGCKKKGKQYLEKTHLAEVKIRMMAKGGSRLEFIDDENNSYNAHDLTTQSLKKYKLFTSREEALEIL